MWLLQHKDRLGIAGRLLILVICLVGSGVMPIYADGSDEEIYAFGTGPVEVVVFTDYYCHPCQEVESYLEEALPRLLQLNVKITFVDNPIHRETPVYSKYFLFAAKKSGTFEGALRIRRVLFDIARANEVASERELVQSIKEKNVAMAFFDVQPVFNRWVERIRLYKIDSTPTCVINRPAAAPEIVSGSEDIPKALDQLLTEMVATR